MVFTLLAPIMLLLTKISFYPKFDVRSLVTDVILTGYDSKKYSLKYYRWPKNAILPTNDSSLF